MALQDSDNFIVGRGDESYKITYQDLKDDLNYVPPPVGTIDTPTVLSPNDGAGGGDTSYINSDTITKVEGGATVIYETDTISNVNGNVLTFPTSKDFDKFELGEVVQDTHVITNIDPSGPTITVSGGSWRGADDSGDFTTDGRYEPNDSYITPPIFNSNGYGGYNANTVDKAFNGSTADYGLPDTGGTWNWTFTGITNVTSLVVYVNLGVLDALKVNGKTPSEYGITSDGSTVDFSSVVTSLDSLSTKYDGGYCYIKAVRVNGAFLVDRSFPGGYGATTLSKTYTYDTKLTVASDQDLDDMSGTVFMTDGQTNADGTFVPASYTPQTSEIASVVVLDNDYQTTTTGPNQNGTLQAVYPSDLFSERHINAYNAAADGAVLFDVGYFSATGGSGNNTAHMIIDPGILVSPSDLVQTNVRTYGPNNPVIINGTYSAGIVPANGNVAYGIKKNQELTTLDLTEFFAAGETRITSMQIEGESSGECGIFSLLINGEMAGSRSTTVLTFTTPNPDLQYFEVGDVVQQTGVTYLGIPEVTRLDGDPFQPLNVGVNSGINPGLYCLTGGVSSVITFTYPEPVDFSTITKFSGGSYSVNKAYTIEFTDPDGNTTSGSGSTAASYSPSDIPVTPPTLVKSFKISGADGYAFLGFYTSSNVFVDTGNLGTAASITATDLAANTMTVDGGSWKGADGTGEQGNPDWYEPSQMWSDLVVGEVEPGFPVTNVFNGVRGQLYGDGCRAVTGTTGLTINLPDIPCNKVTISAYQVWENLDPGVLFVNGVSIDQAGAATVRDYDYIIPGGILKSITWKYISRSGPLCYLNNIKIEDTYLLVDSNIPGGAGDTVVTNSTKSAEGTVLGVDGTEVDLSASTGRWIADNNAGTAFSIAGPSKIDDPLLTNDVELRSSNFSTTPGSSDTLKEIIWDIDGTEYSAGVTNPWSPLSNLTPNTTHTVKVKHKGNTLEDSGWSPTVSFTTGATLRSIVTRIASLEANDIADDATDTTLLTLIAGLTSRIAALEADHTTLMNNNGNNSGY